MSDDNDIFEEGPDSSDIEDALDDDGALDDETFILPSEKKVRTTSVTTLLQRAMVQVQMNEPDMSEGTTAHTAHRAVIIHLRDQYENAVTTEDADKAMDQIVETFSRWISKRKKFPEFNQS
ncbi:MAG: hypothetical protein H6868_09085 [Rhodospirillales bacterium]|nr:hypothetical protein [Rhodospirillales bacterium]